MLPRAHLRGQPAPSPPRATIPPGPRQDGIMQKSRQVGAGWPDQLNVSPDRQMLCKMTDNFRANAMRALPGPDRFAMASAQSFRPDARFTRVISTTAASYINVLASVSPHFDILP